MCVSMCIYIYIYIHVHTCVDIYIYIYINNDNNNVGTSNMISYNILRHNSSTEKAATISTLAIGLMA